jgi:hypothetical protein
MRVGVLKDGDPMGVSLTMWAHAHGLLQLYHQGRLNTDEAGFRRLVKESSGRLFAGIATDAFMSGKAMQEATHGAGAASAVVARTGT